MIIYIKIHINPLLLLVDEASVVVVVVHFSNLIGEGGLDHFPLQLHCRRDESGLRSPGFVDETNRPRNLKLLKPKYDTNYN